MFFEPRKAKNQKNARKLIVFWTPKPKKSKNARKIIVFSLTEIYLIGFSWGSKRGIHRNTQKL